MINKNKTQIDALRKEAMRIRDDAIDHEYDIERDFAANISRYLMGAQLSKALVECRNAVSWDGFYIDDLNRLADGIVKLIDADLQDNIANDIRALTARVSDAETIAISTKEAETLDEARRYLIAASSVIEDGEPSRREKHTVLRRCHWCGRIISDRQLTVVADVEFVFVCTDCLDWERGDGDIIVTRLNAKLATAEPETPIYETLAPGECLIISKSGDSLLVACNYGGELIVKRVQNEYAKDTHLAGSSGMNYWR